MIIKEKICNNNDENDLKSVNTKLLFDTFEVDQISNADHILNQKEALS